MHLQLRMQSRQHHRLHRALHPRCQQPKHHVLGQQVHATQTPRPDRAAPGPNHLPPQTSRRGTGTMSRPSTRRGTTARGHDLRRHKQRKGLDHHQLAGRAGPTSPRACRAPRCHLLRDRSRQRPGGPRHPLGYGASHVYRSTNGGGAWTDITGALPAQPFNCIALNPTDSTHAYAGSDFGVFENTAVWTGNTWTNITGNLPAVSVQELGFNMTDGS